MQKDFYEKLAQEKEQLPINVSIFKVINKAVNDVKKNNISILDLGARRAELYSWLKKKTSKNIDYVGIKISKDYVKQCKRMGIDCKQANLDNLKIKLYKKFDIIVASHILEHLKRPYNLLEKCIGFVSNEGKIIIALPNNNNFRFLVANILNLKGYPRQHNGHINSFSPVEIKNICRFLGLKIISIEYHDFNLPLIGKVQFLGKILPRFCEQFTMVISK